MSGNRRVTLVAAYATGNRAIGKGGHLPWHLPEDLAHFRSVTTGQVIVMGRKTYESIGRPLPNRRTIVVSGNPGWRPDSDVAKGLVAVAPTVKDALLLTGWDAMVVGGEKVYRTAMPYATHQILTEVRLDVEGDTFYPTFDTEVWEEVKREVSDTAPLDRVWWRRRDWTPSL